MQWHIDEEELDEFQEHVQNLRLDGSYVVSGNAGSGKTVLALWRAKLIQNLNEGDFTVLVYTKALRKFIENGVRAIGLNEANVINYDQWKRNPICVDYIIIDEAQDFVENRIRRMISKARTGVMLFGDTAQQLYPIIKNERTLTIREIAQLTGFDEKPLKLNHRLPKPVAKFAELINQVDNLVDTCQNEGGPKPRIIRFENWRKELDFIMREIDSRGFSDVGILLPFNKKSTTGMAPEHYSVESVKTYFEENDFDALYKIKDDDDLAFDSDLPKGMTYHSSKGLQFETVFLPHCGESWWKYRNPLYVALTRTSRNIIITYSDNLTAFFDKIPRDLYETR